MENVKAKLISYNIEWDGPIIFIHNNSVTILSPFIIFDKLDLSNGSTQSSVLKRLEQFNSRKELIKFLELLGHRLLAIKT